MAQSAFKRWTIFVGMMLVTGATDWRATAQAMAPPPASTPKSQAQVVLAASPSSDEAREAFEQQKAIQVIRHYYAAINRRDYARAYAAWGDHGKTSQLSFDQFKQSFANTKSIGVSFGAPGHIDAAVGSLYLKIPVTIVVSKRNRSREYLDGYYVLRRCNDVPGCTQADRTWHLYSAIIKPVE